VAIRIRIMYYLSAKLEKNYVLPGKVFAAANDQKI
jgi:hypothetical protein